MIAKSIRRLLTTVVISFVFFCRCDWSGFLNTKRLIILNYPIETNLDVAVVRKYMDTLITKKGFAVPDKWKYLRKLVDIDSVNNVRIYFKDKPEEMYLISYSGMIVLSDVYNPKIVEYDWVSKRELLPKTEFIRIQLRINKLFQKIDSMANPGCISKVWIKMR